MASKESITACVAMLCESYRTKPTKATFMAFGEVFRDMDDSSIRKATYEVMRSDRVFMPAPGELLRLATDIEQRSRRAAITAWEHLKNFGRADELSARLADSLPYERNTIEWYTLGRSEFLESYVQAVRDTKLLSSKPDARRLKIEN